MPEKWEERDRRRLEIVAKAVSEADRIILAGSDGSVEETNFLTAVVARRFMEKALTPFNAALQKKEISGN